MPTIFDLVINLSRFLNTQSSFNILLRIAKKSDLGENTSAVLATTTLLTNHLKEDDALDILEEIIKRDNLGSSKLKVLTHVVNRGIRTGRASKVLDLLRKIDLTIFNETDFLKNYFMTLIKPMQNIYKEDPIAAEKILTMLGRNEEDVEKFLGTLEAMEKETH